MLMDLIRSVAIFGSHNRSQSSSDFFPTDVACAAYLEKARWNGYGFVVADRSGGGRTVPLRKSSWRLALPRVPP